MNLAIAWIFFVAIAAVGRAEGQSVAGSYQPAPPPDGHSAPSAVSYVAPVAASFGHPKKAAEVSEASRRAAAESQSETLRRLESTLTARTAHLRLLRALAETSDAQRRQENLLIDEIRAQRLAIGAVRRARRDERRR